MLFKIFTLILTFSFTLSCPPKEDIHPCICQTTNPLRTYVECAGIEDDSELLQSIGALKSLKRIYMFTIEDTALRFVPHNLFQGMDIHQLEFKSSSIISYSDTDIALEGLEQSLEKLRFIDCNFMNSWDWTVFRNLEKLSILDIVGGDMEAVQEDVREIGHLKLKVVTISKTKVSHLDDYAFSNFTGLQYITLSRNLISEVKRSMLPNPAYELNDIDLSDNELQDIPEDFFTNMPNLQYVLISKNKLLTLREETFAPVWYQLVALGANDNKFRCDCRMKWILEKSGLQSLGAYCDEPSQYRGKKVESFKPKDFWC